MRTYFFFSLPMFLLACGGGSVPPLDPPPPGEPDISITLTSGNSVLDTLAPVSELRNIYNPTNEEVIIGIFSDAALSTEVFNNSISDLEGSTTLSDGMYFSTQTGQTSTGADLTLSIAGVYINNSADEFVSRIFIETETGQNAYAIAGSPVQAVPSGEVTYTGWLELIEFAGQTETPETGAFTFTADFSQSQVRGGLSGATDSFVISGDNILMSKTDGTFSASDVQVGRISGGAITADSYGTLFGQTGQGIGGVIVTDESTDIQYIGAFVGSK